MTNKQRANRVLVGLFILFLGVLLIRHQFPEVAALRFIKFVIEAALVGGIADWFAVTALFRKPLGISAHTAVIPRNRDRLVGAVSTLVEEELLSPQLLQQQIENINMSQSLISWVERQGWNKQLGDFLFQQISKHYANIDPSQFANRVAIELRHHIQGQNLLPAFWKFIDSLRSEESKANRFNQFLDYLEELVSGPKMQERVAAQLYRFIERKFMEGSFAKVIGEPSIMNGMVSGLVQDAAVEIQKHVLLKLRQMQHSTDPLRMVLQEQLLALIAEYRENPYKERQLIHLMDEMVDQMPVREILSQTIEGAARWALTPVQPNTRSPLQEWLNAFSLSSWEVFKQNQDFQAQLNHFLAGNISWLVKSEHKMIGNLVKDVLSKLTDEELNQFVESKVGEDLHWIRLNGSIIGALAGVILFGLLNFVYDPFISPMLVKWLQ